MSALDPTISLADLIRADHARLAEDGMGRRLLMDALFHKTFRMICAHRLYRHAKVARGVFWRLAAKPLGLWRRFTSLSIGAEIAWEAEIGPGFRVLHGFGLVILPCARIGRNVTVTHGSCVGYRGSPENPSQPRSIGVLGDSCFVGPYAMVWAKVGRGALVSPHSVVLRDAPDGAVLVGAPAEVRRILPEEHWGKAA